MDTRHNRSSHVIAAIGSIIFLTFLPIFFYFVLIFVTADFGGPLNLILIPCSNLIAAILFTGIFFFPLSKLLDWLSQRVSPNGQYSTSSLLVSGVVLILILGMVISGFALVLGIILENRFLLEILSEQELESVVVWFFSFLFLGGVPFFLGGATYWFLLQTSRKVLSSRKGKQEFNELPKAG